jgi:hypothetical protein
MATSQKRTWELLFPILQFLDSAIFTKINIRANYLDITGKLGTQKFPIYQHSYWVKPATNL